VPRYPNNGSKPPMSLITVSLTKHYKEVLDTFVDKGVVPSRSAAVRLALSYGLPYLQQMLLDQEILIEYSRIGNMNNNRIPADCIFVEMQFGKFQKYQMIGGD